jgi:hypothetical protein
MSESTETQRSIANTREPRPAIWRWASPLWAVHVRQDRAVEHSFGKQLGLALASSSTHVRDAHIAFSSAGHLRINYAYDILTNERSPHIRGAGLTPKIMNFATVLGH